MKYQYYERVSLLKSRDGGNRMTDDRSREFSEANVVPSGKAGKRQIIYKIGDDDE